MHYPPATHHTEGYPGANTSLQRLHSIAPDLLQALTAIQQLHPKQRALLQFLNQHRDAHDAYRTTSLSYTQLHKGTGISIEHIRRNALPRLLKNGLLNVLAQTFSGTIYEIRYNQKTIQDVLAHLQPDSDIMPASTTPPLSTHEPYDLVFMVKELETLRHLQQQRQIVLREEFAAGLTPDQLRWLILTAKHLVDTQEGIRFIKDRFPHYEAARIALLDEWRLRAQYGEHIPSTSVPEGAIP